jgi:hypothetical protein
MSVRARQGPKPVVCAKTNDSEDAEVRPNADHENFCHIRRLIRANMSYRPRRTKVFLEFPAMTFFELNHAKIAAFDRYRRCNNDEYVGNLRAFLLNFVFAAP